MLENLQKGKKGSSKGESRDVLNLSTKEAGKGGRPENYKQVRWKLQSDRLNRGWRDQPQLVQVDDILARTRCFQCGASCEGLPSEQGTDHKFRDSGHPRNDFCAGQSRNISRAGVFETTLMLVTLETNPVLKFILETSFLSMVTFKEMTKLSSVFKEMM